MSAVTDLVELWSASRHALAIVERRLDLALTENLGISFTTYAVLCTLAELDRDNTGVSQQQLAQVLGIDKSNISRHVELAARSGQLNSTPSPTSRRTKSVALTDAGHATLAAAEEIVAEFSTKLDLTDIRAATTFLTAIGDAAEG